MRCTVFRQTCFTVYSYLCTYSVDINYWVGCLNYVACSCTLSLKCIPLILHPYLWRFTGPFWATILCQYDLWGPRTALFHHQLQVEKAKMASSFTFNHLRSVGFLIFSILASSYDYLYLSASISEDDYVHQGQFIFTLSHMPQIIHRYCFSFLWIRNPLFTN